MLAAWLVGFEEDSAEDAGEICMAELFGEARGSVSSRVNAGLKAHGDPRLSTDMATVELEIDTAELHVYRAEWDAHRVRFLVDGVEVRVVEQGLSYPVQLMIDLFEFPVSERREPAAYPKRALVRAVRGWEP